MQRADCQVNEDGNDAEINEIIYVNKWFVVLGQILRLFKIRRKMS